MKKIIKRDVIWKRQLSKEQYEICRCKGTELAFTGKYYACKDSGIYHCVCCGAPLFSSDTKYDSGSGWPSFWAPIDDSSVSTRLDTRYGMRRIEVSCSQCDAHLGHIFDDGPLPSRQRYCINSVALDLHRGEGDEV